jgi:hypothetical protein
MPAAAPNPIKPSWYVWTVLGLALFVIIGFYSVQMTNNYDSFESKRAAARYETLNKLRADEQAILTTAAWVDQSKQVVRIPIDEAMAEEIDILKAKPVAMGSVIPVINATPAAPATTAPPATNVAPSTPAQPKP